MATLREQAAVVGNTTPDRTSQASVKRNSPASVASPFRIGLFGCPLDTGNKGVSALALSAIRGLGGGSLASVTLFDHGRGERISAITIGRNQYEICQVGCYDSRRYYRLGNLRHMYWAAMAGLADWHPMLRRLRQFHAILDVSGGDSFSDLYGRRRFRAISLPKLVALELGIPLVLLPQTYGPYAHHHIRTVAKRILCGATQVWSRDSRSLQQAKDFLGDSFDATRHLCGVDMAFGLPAHRPTDQMIAATVEQFSDGAELLLGVNVSGLLYNRPGDDLHRYGFRISYRQLVDRLLRCLLGIDGARLMLVPHVGSSVDGLDCDATAIRSITRQLSPTQSKRVLALPWYLDAAEVKWAIGKCSWFCGTRMHACIAAISQSVPTIAIAYSDKTAGVFETAGVRGSVVEPRIHSECEVIAHIMEGLNRRREVETILQAHIPAVQLQLTKQFHAIIACIRKSL